MLHANFQDHRTSGSGGKSYEPLIGGVSACTAHFTHSFAIFSELGGQLFCLYPLYISFNGIKYCHVFVELVFLAQVMTKYSV